MVAAAVAAVLASWAFNALVHLVWHPHAITRRFRAQGVRGPDYRFFSGSLGEIKRLHGEGAAVTLDVDDHDFIPMVQPVTSDAPATDQQGDNGRKKSKPGLLGRGSPTHVLSVRPGLISR
jgi:hypothetical protein